MKTLSFLIAGFVLLMKAFEFIFAGASGLIHRLIEFCVSLIS